MKYLYLILTSLIPSGIGLNHTDGIPGKAIDQKYVVSYGKIQGNSWRPRGYPKNQYAQSKRKKRPQYYPSSMFYRDKDVLSWKMRYRGFQSNCSLAFTPAREFHTDLNMRLKPPKRGQCTEWADGRYYQLTGYHVDFLNGYFDATLWDQKARDAGWSVSTKPVAPSIMVIKNTVPGYGRTGHVAVVESTDGVRVCTSNWNSPKPMKLSMKVINLRQQEFWGQVFFLTKRPHHKKYWLF